MSPAIIEGCQRGEPEAFEELVRQTHRQVYSLALRLTGNPEDAAEVAQDTYIKVLKGIRSFRGDSKFSTWLYRVTSSAAITALRKGNRRRFDVSLETLDWRELPGDSDPAAEAEGKDMLHRLEEAVRSLPDGYRAVVVMKDMYGLKAEEIAKELGITEGAVKVRLLRARRKLQGMVGKDYFVDEGRERKQSNGMP